MKKIFTFMAAALMAVGANAADDTVISLSGLSLSNFTYADPWSVNSSSSNKLDYNGTDNTYNSVTLTGTNLYFSYKQKSTKEGIFIVNDNNVTTNGKGFRINLSGVEAGDTIIINVGSKGKTAASFAATEGCTADANNPTLSAKSGNIAYSDLKFIATATSVIISESAGGFAITSVTIRKAESSSEGKTITAAYEYTTHCYDVNLDFTNVTDIEAYYVSELTSTQATLSKVEGIIPASTGFIVLNKNSSETTEFTVPVAAEASEGGTTNYLVGVTAETPLADGEAYILTEDGFVPTAEGTLPANRAYLKASDITGNGAKLAIVFDNATGINEVNAAAKSGKIYNLQGIEVKNADKGLFIINGKKVIK